MLEVRSLSTGYDGARILWDVSLTVAPGEIVALMGPNGSGKSTLMNSVSGLVRPWSGEIVFEGRPITALPAHARIGLGIAHVLERHRLFPYMSVLENLELGCGPRAPHGALEHGLAQAYAMFPRLRERAAQTASTLSGGEQQMCAIARGLMCRPRLLLVDEPFIGLSPRMCDEVFEALRRIHAEGVAVLLIEQNVRRSLELSDRAYVLRDGRVALTADSASLRESGEVERVFFGEPVSSSPSGVRSAAASGSAR